MSALDGKVALVTVAGPPKQHALPGLLLLGAEQGRSARARDRRGLGEQPRSPKRRTTSAHAVVRPANAIAAKH